MPNGRTDDRGQVLSSLAAVVAVVAIAAGFVVLFVTRGDDSAADATSGGTTISPPRPTATTSASVPPATVTPSDSPATPSDSPSSTPSLPAMTPEPTQSPTPSASVTPVPTAQLPAVEVFNNTRRRGLAEDVANKARTAGWTVTGADNWHGKIVASTVYYPAGMRAEATQLADQLGIDRLKDALPNMKKDRLTVILTEDYSG
jgi:LytR cell envelope-related transcriptional attenuator